MAATNPQPYGDPCKELRRLTITQAEELRPA
jgi:hypothetical protein